MDVDRVPPPEDPPAIGRVYARNYLDGHALAGTVVTAQGGDLAGADTKVDPAQGPDRAEVFLYALQLEKGRPG